MRVRWSESALDALSELYVQLTLDQQRLLARNVEAINGRLALDPLSVGESREKHRRIWFYQRLVVIYKAYPDGRVVVQSVGPNPASWFR